QHEIGTFGLEQAKRPLGIGRAQAPVAGPAQDTNAVLDHVGLVVDDEDAWSGTHPNRSLPRPARERAGRGDGAGRLWLEAEPASENSTLRFVRRQAARTRRLRWGARAPATLRRGRGHSRPGSGFAAPRYSGISGRPCL